MMKARSNVRLAGSLHKHASKGKGSETKSKHNGMTSS